MSRKVLISGGAGFFGHHLVEHLLKNTPWDVVVVDKLNYASFGYDRLRDIKVYDSERVHTVNHDFTLPPSQGLIRECLECDYFVHLAAETHVDNSIKDPYPFILSNTLGTYHAYLLASLIGVEKFIYFSTDEEYGPAPEGVFFKEDSPLNPSNPYAASKAGGWALINSFINTYDFPALISRSMNLFGERQHPEKFIPMVIKKILGDETITIHADSTLTAPGSRVYLHCRNASAAVLYLLRHGETGEIYNVVGDKEIDNLQMAQMIASIIGKPLKYSLVDFHSSRPGHDLRYAMDGTKLAELGFRYKKDLEESLEKMVEWTLENPEWLR